MKIQTKNQPLWKQISRSVRTFPYDLTGVIVLLVFINAVFRLEWLTGATIADARVRTLLGIPVLLFVPGYLLVSILFPSGVREEHEDWGSTLQHGIDWVERLALSFGMSVALLPIFALVLGTWWSFTATAVVNGFTVFLVVGVALAAFQRIRTPEQVRYSVGSLAADLGFERTGFRGGLNVDNVASIILVIAILAAVGSVGYAVATPYQGSPSSTLYLATENETGNLATSEYPSELTAGEPAELVVGIENSEERPQEYTIVAMVEEVQPYSTGATITAATEVGRLHTTVPAGEGWNSTHTVVPEMVGEDLRLHYYLYRGETAPDTPRPETAYRDVYIWINVSSA